MSEMFRGVKVLQSLSEGDRLTNEEKAFIRRLVERHPSVLTDWYYQEPTPLVIVDSSEDVLEDKDTVANVLS